jgi:hypothetical protein
VISERELQKAGIELLHRFGYLVAHFRPAQVRQGRWVTPVDADGAGFPDVVAIKGERLLAIELKVGRNKPTDAQHLWLERFRAVPGCRSLIITEKNMDFLERVAKGGESDGSQEASSEGAGQEEGQPEAA